MPKPTPETETLKITEVKRQLSRLVNAVYSKERRFLIEKSGIPVAAIVSLDDLERLARFEQEWNDRFAIVDKMREAFSDIPPDETERDVVALVREIRDEDEAARHESMDAIAERRPA